MSQRQVRVHVRNTHPGLYRSIMALSLMSVGLAVNFWTSNPTFNPLGISKNLVGLIFFLLGGSQIIFLNLRDLREVRIGMAVSAFVMFCWGAANTQQALDGRASFQLPVLYLALSVLQFLLLIEPPVNPMTKKEP